jgi:hypothetical protein
VTEEECQRDIANRRAKRTCSESDPGMVTEALAIGASERKIKRDEIGRREA